MKTAPVKVCFTLVEIVDILSTALDAKITVPFGKIQLRQLLLAIRFNGPEACWSGRS